MKKVDHFYYIIPIFLGLIFWLTASLIFPHSIDSANLTGVKNTLSNSRLSFVGAVDGDTDADSSILIASTAPPSWATSNNNQNLFSGDNLMIGLNTDYTVVDIIDSDKIQVSPVIGAGDEDEDGPIIATRSAQHTVEFTPVSVIPDGYFRVRIKATDGTQAQSIDGIPDADGFDFGESFDPGWITCSVGTTAIEYGGDTNCPSGWTCVFCDYSDSNNTDPKSITIGTANPDEQPINPAPSSTTKTQGEADTYTFYVDHLDSDYELIDSTQGRIAVVESVRVTAVVEPTIEFQISGIGSGVTACGVSSDVSTEATYVAFGALEISDFIDAAQKLSAATNAASGFSVTAQANNELRMIGATGPLVGTTIPDTTCDAGDCTAGSNTNWDDPDFNGFGYSLQSLTGTATFEWSADDFSARPFSNIGAGETAAEIMASAGPAETEEINVCYRITISALQEPGTYENAVTYIATANF